MKSRAIRVALALSTCSFMACDEEQQVRPASQLQLNQPARALVLQVTGPHANADKTERCLQTLHRLGAHIDPAAPVRVTLTLNDGGNQLQVFAAAHGVVLDEPRPPWTMEQLCEDAFWAAQEAIDEEDHASEEMAARPPMPPIPPGVVPNKSATSNNTDDDDDDDSNVPSTASSESAAGVAPTSAAPMPSKAEGAALLRKYWPTWQPLKDPAGKAAKVAFDKTDYKTAAEKLRALRTAGSPDLLAMFDLALVLDHDNEVAGAMRYYQMFLDKSESKAQTNARAAAEKALAALREY